MTSSNVSSEVHSNAKPALTYTPAVSGGSGVQRSGSTPRRSRMGDTWVSTIENTYRVSPIWSRKTRATEVMSTSWLGQRRRGHVHVMAGWRRRGQADEREDRYDETGGPRHGAPASSKTIV